MSHSASYVFSTYSFINTNPIDKLLDVGYQSKEGNPIPSFDENLLIELCTDAQNIFETENNILEIEGDTIIVGDIHGSFHDLLRILKYIQENDSKVLFLGDYVDRGNFSLECITILLALKIMKPEKYFLIRGNHEFDAICRQYGFYDEIINYHNPKKVKNTAPLQTEQNLTHSDSFILKLHLENSSQINSSESNDINYVEYDNCYVDKDCYRYSEKLYQAFIKVFSYLPIAAIVNKTNFCIHGGLSPALEKTCQIENEIKRPINDFEENRLISDIVWSDPSTSFTFLYSNNPRGRGCLFNQIAAFDFLNENSFNRMIRAHECVKDGSSNHFHDRCLTVFSASSYSKEVNNKSGIIKLFQKDDTIEIVTFQPLRRLDKSEAVYYKVQSLNNINSKKISKFFSFRHPNLTSESSIKKIHNISSKRIRFHQSLSPQRFPKPLFRSTTKKEGQSVPKSLLYHSESLDILDQKQGNNNLCIENPKAKIRNLSSLEPLPSLVDDF